MTRTPSHYPEPEERLAMLVDQAVAKAIERAGVNPVNLTINITINQVSGGGATMHVSDRYSRREEPT